MSFFDAFWQPHNPKALSPPMPHPHGLGALLTYLDAAHNKLEANATPDLEVRETSSAYYLEVELPGVSDRENDILVKWTSSRTLAIQGVLRRSDITREWGDEYSNKHTDSIKSTETPKDEKLKQEESSIIFKERRIGKFYRTFTFPVDVESSKLRAKLEDGLLKIRVPKRQGDHHPEEAVYIE